jgi:hypothetical protein
MPTLAIVRLFKIAQCGNIFIAGFIIVEIATTLIIRKKTTRRRKFLKSPAYPN